MEARIGAGTTWGEHCVFGANVVLGKNCQVGNHVVFHDDTVIGETQFTGILPAGASLDQTFHLRMPRDVGTYWVVAVTDALNTAP